MKLAKQLGEPPRDVAARVTEKLGDAGGLLAVGGGLRARVRQPRVLARGAGRVGDARARRPAARRRRRRARAQTIVVDYSAPERRQGDARRAPALDDHRRRARARCSSSPGHKRDPAEPPRRLGHAVRDADPVPASTPRHRARRPTSTALGGLYREAKHARSTSDPAFADRAAPARRRAAGRRPGHPRAVAGSSTSRARTFQPSTRRSTSCSTDERRRRRELLQRPACAEVVAELLEAGVAVESDGALSSSPSEFKDPRRHPAALIVRKSDGGYGYGDHRPGHDPLPDPRPARRPAHLRRRRPPGPALPDGLRRRRGAPAGWRRRRASSTSRSARCSGEDGKPFKTRSGGTVRLVGPARRRGRARPRGRRRARARSCRTAERARDRATPSGSARSSTPTCPPAAPADYSSTSTGCSRSTATPASYLQYAHARIRSILRKAGEGETVRRRDASLDDRGARPRAQARRLRRRAGRRRRGAASRTGCAATSTSSRRRSRRSTRRARCSRRPTPRRARPASRCARSPPATLKTGLRAARHHRPRAHVS